MAWMENQMASDYRQIQHAGDSAAVENHPSMHSWHQMHYKNSIAKTIPSKFQFTNDTSACSVRVSKRQNSPKWITKHGAHHIIHLTHRTHMMSIDTGREKKAKLTIIQKLINHNEFGVLIAATFILITLIVSIAK